ncbi:MAG: hypothetical protein AAGU21_00715 [Solidesulfovibrio sp.]|jgi:hypothetical protein|uniref:hypothetical protein n=1 Tax=Solidesulfovibrio sp. TaxID=2910990 RepID=UPI002B1FB6D9|nr:hypothetical protein [Solidesulfovibrio sp.]MEA4857324.1 hypothetical protein [Solidesulfovibrio sp.]
MPIDLTTVFQTMPYVQNVAHAELVQPQAALAASQEMARQALADQAKQPQKIDQQDAMDAVKDDRERQAPGQHQPRGRRRPQPEPEQTQASNASPFAGHIVDRKI